MQEVFLTYPLFSPNSEGKFTYQLPISNAEQGQGLFYSLFTSEGMEEQITEGYIVDLFKDFNRERNN